MGVKGDLHFEDLEVGATFDCGTYTVTEEEILEYARRWDPLPFHVDRDAASETHWGGLIASGLHTMAICNKLTTENLYLNTTTMGGPGIEDPTFRRPVRPGDVLSVTVEITEKIPSESKPDRGLVKFGQTVTNGDGETVLSMRTVSFLERR